MYGETQPGPGYPMDFYGQTQPPGNYSLLWDLISKNVPVWYDALETKSTWNTIQGTSFTNIIGLPLGGRVINVMGSDTRVVCPWLGVLKRLATGPDSEVTKCGMIMGIGGDTTMVIGEKNYFTYLSDKMDCDFSVNKIEVNYQIPEGLNIDGFDKTGAMGSYYAPAITAILGALVITVMTLCLKYIWKFTSSDITTNNPTIMKGAMLAFPLFESRWLYLVKLLHTAGFSSIPLKIGEELGEVVEAAKEGSREASLLRTQLNDLEEVIVATKAKLDKFQIQIDNYLKRPIAGYQQPDFSSQGALAVWEQANFQHALLGKLESQKAEIIAKLAEEEAKAAKAAAKLAAIKS